MPRESASYREPVDRGVGRFAFEQWETESVSPDILYRVRLRLATEGLGRAPMVVIRYVPGSEALDRLKADCANSDGIRTLLSITEYRTDGR